MTRVLVIAEHDEGALSSSTLNTIGAATVLSPDCIDVAVLAAKGEEIAAAASHTAGVSRVLLIDRPENAPYLAAVWAPQVAELAADYTHVFAPATTFGKDLMPRAAALLGVGALSDITAIDGPYRFERPAFAGNAILKVQADANSILLATVRTTAFDRPDEQALAPIESRTVQATLPIHTRFVERGGANVSGPDLQTANVVVAGGRGLGGDRGVELIKQLAQKLGAAVGASRAAVDSGWMANDLQVGQTGKIIAPKLYISIGISGAIQHLTGIKDSGTIVAINKDADAPICKLADIVLIADLFSALPELIDGLDNR
jgi:electron transfer flavoprotein alpha subunit